jgi:hypothetical protein
MEILKEKTSALLSYFTWVGQNPLVNSQDKDRMAVLIHPDFLITYNGKEIICGIDQLGPHFVDAFKEIGHWQIEPDSFELLGRRYCIARYSVVTEKKGSTPCKVIYEFQNGLAVGQHEEVDFSKNKINTENWVRANNVRK